MYRVASSKQGLWSWFAWRCALFMTDVLTRERERERERGTPALALALAFALALAPKKTTCIQPVAAAFEPTTVRHFGSNRCLGGAQLVDILSSRTLGFSGRVCIRGGLRRRWRRYPSPYLRPVHLGIFPEERLGTLTRRCLARRSFGGGHCTSVSVSCCCCCCCCRRWYASSGKLHCG
jgi:hypothetical protein